MTHYGRASRRRAVTSRAARYSVSARRHFGFASPVALTVLVVALYALAASTGSAHHSVSAIFDADDQVTIDAELIGVRWINPHIRLSLQPVDSEQFPEIWEFESQPPQWYRRVGVSRKTFEDAIGQNVIVFGLRARNGEPFGFLRRLTFEDGTTFEMVPDDSEFVE